MRRILSIIGKGYNSLSRPLRKSLWLHLILIFILIISGIEAHEHLKTLPLQPTQFLHQSVQAQFITLPPPEHKPKIKINSKPILKTKPKPIQKIKPLSIPKKITHPKKIKTIHHKPKPKPKKIIHHKIKKHPDLAQLKSFGLAALQQGVKTQKKLDIQKNYQNKLLSIRNRYLGLIEQNITNHWVNSYQKSNLKLDILIQIKLNKLGKVLSVKILKSSQNPHFDQQVINAIWKSSPLPIPPSRELQKKFFKSITILFSNIKDKD